MLGAARGSSHLGVAGVLDRISVALHVGVEDLPATRGEDVLVAFVVGAPAKIREHGGSGRRAVARKTSWERIGEREGRVFSQERGACSLDDFPRVGLVLLDARVAAHADVVVDVEVEEWP